VSTATAALLIPWLLHSLTARTAVTVHQQLTSSLPFLGWMLLQKLWLCELAEGATSLPLVASTTAAGCCCRCFAATRAWKWSGRSFDSLQTLLPLQRVVMHVMAVVGGHPEQLLRVVRLQSRMRLTSMKALQWPCMTRVQWETWLVAS
jgi:hypothetical protein